MKNVAIVTLLILFSLPSLFAQTTLPVAQLQTLDGQRINASELETEGSRMLIIFWNANDHNAYTLFENISESYAEGMFGNKLNIIGICGGDLCLSDGVRASAADFGVDVQVYLDENGDFHRKMGVQKGPYTMLFDEDMNLLSRYAGFCQCADMILLEQLESLNPPSYISFEGEEKSFSSEISFNGSGIAR